MVPLPITDMDICDLGPDSSECIICHEALQLHEDNKTAAQLTCGHVFGRKCITRWLEFGTTCPMCRAAVNEIPQNLETPWVIKALYDGSAKSMATVLRAMTYMVENSSIHEMPVVKLIWLCAIISIICLR